MNKRLLSILGSILLIAGLYSFAAGGINDRFAPLELVDVTATAPEINKLHGIDSGDVVTTTNTKTLTNKTLTSPTITSPTVTSPTVTSATITAPTVTLLDTTYNVATHVYTTTADWEMSATEAKAILLSVSSGSGSTILNIIAPDVSGRLYAVRNGSDNLNWLYIKKSGGTGVAIASNTTAIVIHNGTNYIRLTANAAH